MPVSARMLRAKRTWSLRDFSRPDAGVRRRSAPDLGDALQGKMMVAHDEFVAGQRIERIFEFRRLGNGEIAGIRHAVELTLQQRLACRLAQKREGLGEHERQRSGQQPVEHTDRGGGRVLLDTQHGAHPGVGRRAILDGFRAEKQPRARQHLVERTRGSGMRCRSPLISKPKIFEQRRTDDPACR